MTHTTCRWRGLLAAITAVLAALAVTSAPSASASALYHEQYRPQFHFSPAENWMNDPNGLIYYKGVYNLYYQDNPTGNTWGDMSWGHATSTDLVHWTQQPLAIAGTADEAIFSGSAVLDSTDSSGFGTAADPPLVAVYTSAYSSGIQAQSLAYSLDGGETWTKYADNPVLNLDSQNFRDPKVFWYAPTKSWRMVVSLAAQDQIQIYSSPNLKSWTLLSTFGPDNAADGVWEMPDLFPLALDGDQNDVKWVMVVGVDNKEQYFVGSFDGTTFTPDEPATYTPPTGTVYEGFDSGTYDGWTSTGTAFGSAPATGTLPNQQTVSGYAGTGLVNSYNGGDSTIGTLTSPSFTVSSPYLNFLVGGGDQPYVSGSVYDSPAPAGSTVFASFSGSTWGDGWVGTGSFANTGPTTESLPGAKDASVLDTCVAGCDPATGTITSPTFTVSSDYIDFLIAGGDHPLGQPGPTAVELLVGGKVVASATGDDSGDMNWVNWQVAKYRGQQAQIEVVDQNDGSGNVPWGHIMVDDIVFANQPAAPYDRQAAVDLVIGGKVVASATGDNAENLDWASFDLREYQGRQAQIEIVDHATEGWGHILADQFTFASQPANGALARSRWVDDGSDFYAAGTFDDAPGGRQIMIGWMNDWNYGQSIPTSPWRSADSIPRVLSLRSVGGVATLEQTPISGIDSLATGSPTAVHGVAVSQGTTSLPVSGNELDISATLNAGSASDFGLEVDSGTYSTGAPQYTKIGYDKSTGEVYIDRTNSGYTTFGSGFAGVQSAKLPLDGDSVTLRILVDAASVEVFADGGQVTLTDQIYPDSGSTGVAAYANGGTAVVTSLNATRLGSIWP
ncbi:GH32 C-terminal domain-containing protein [Actinospica sp. MGRD01-02]|uniref:GH32 C-terminal domain-containing protein n=1 Tax=Actinospica acidithermotolerans TaxID=2828514 RepID=A0A941EFH5_9ACTN|nr:glycoside hydrolase family 32 protein [Actinospica acidithermotolerans]MBR7830506.1 GH32 C-terminal domain-containing protein [Actinospica acidithermotolerans]